MRVSAVGRVLATAGAGWLLQKLVRRIRYLELRDAAVLITGGSRGLGLILAREFGRHGARLAICARDPAELERASADLRSRGITVITLRCDITDRGQVGAMVQEAARELGTIDVLVNNAGSLETHQKEASR